MSGWGSWLSGDTSATDAQPNFKAISDTPQDKLYGPLEAADLEWTCAGGFTTETHTWYTVLQDGTFATSQIIHSAVGLWYPQVQITFKLFNPKTGQKIWKSVNVSHFAAPPPEPIKGTTYDKRSCKGEQFTVLYHAEADGSEAYSIEANMDTDLQLAYTFTRPKQSAGWKLGAGPNGGKSYFGSKPSQPDGYAFHCFWPQVKTSGHIILKGQAIDAAGTGMYVRAIQGMRPNLVASRWNFANFQSGGAEGVSAILMEFTTTSDYGGPVGSRTKKDESGKTVSKREPVVVTVGSVTIGGELVAVTAATRDFHQPDGESSRGSLTRIAHIDRTRDTETGYDVPQKIKYTWQGPLLEGGKADTSSAVDAELSVDVGKPVPPSESKGLVDKVDVLGEVPYMVRKMVNYVAGTKPYIYQYLNPASLKLTLPESYKGSQARESTVEGTLFCETTFISEP